MREWLQGSTYAKRWLFAFRLTSLVCYKARRAYMYHDQRRRRVSLRPMVNNTWGAGIGAIIRRADAAFAASLLRRWHALGVKALLL